MDKAMLRALLTTFIGNILLNKRFNNPIGSKLKQELNWHEF